MPAKFEYTRSGQGLQSARPSSGTKKTAHVSSTTTTGQAKNTSAKPRRQSHPNENFHGRSRVVMAILYLLFLGIIGRLFFWQVVHRSVLLAQAESQYNRTISMTGHRGKILSSDGYVFVTNRTEYRLFAQPAEMKTSPVEVTDKLVPLLAEDQEEQATDPAQLALVKEDLKNTLLPKLSNKDLKWVALKQKVSEETKLKIADLKIHGLGFEGYEIRDYPEASMAAQVVGFVGKNKEGGDQGYFGVEGALDRELRGYAQQQTFMKDALGFHLIFDQSEQPKPIDGRDVVLTIRRDVQHVVEDLLKEGMEKYGASAGEVVIMEPKTGKILAMASYPNYNPGTFYQYPQEYLKNPSAASMYEPGSTFKVLTMAAGIDTGVITPETECTNCEAPRKIAQYTIKTWNNQYHPNIMMKDALAKSDNVAMIFISEMVGKEKFLDYIHKFGIGDETHIDLQEDTSTPMRKDWKEIDLATGSFGQGVGTTALQMVRAVGAIANQGKMMRPTIVEKVIDTSRGTESLVQPLEEKQVVSPQTAQTVSHMMEYAVENGEAKWTASKNHRASGKTGTAQIPIDGHYDDQKTMASFIGFAPPDDPKFVMLVKLQEPKSSPWAAETAAPLWFKIADKLFLLLNIPPDK
jgi:cell division protein FtsI (penicillin-binding protein 3)